MALETATYIDDLNTANPAPTDLIGQGDDHIRLIKAVLQATFPNITGPVTLTQTEINTLIGLGTPFGVIAAWYGASVAVPAGWAVCNGATVAKSDGSGNITVPDLRNQVILGCGTLQPTVGGAYGASPTTGTTGAGGAHSHSTTAGGGAHSHAGATVAGHVLTEAELPAHDHGNGVNDGLGTAFCYGTQAAVAATARMDVTAGGPVFQGKTEAVGSGAAHTHALAFTGLDGIHTHTTDAAATHTHSVSVPSYQPALSFHYIMKV